MNSAKKYQPSIQGMSCTACAGSIEKVLKGTPGVIEVAVNYANEKASIVIDEEVTNIELIQKQVNAIGYELLIDNQNKATLQNHKNKKYRNTLFNTIGAGLLAVPIMLIGMVFMNWPYANISMLLLSTPVLFIFGKHFFINAYKQAKIGTANMDTLVAISTGVAYLFSVFNTLFPHFFHQFGLHSLVYYESAAVVIFFVSLGKLLEEKAKNNTSNALEKLINLQPKTVTAIRNGQELTIKLEEIAIGDLIIVKPGERIAVDGRVKRGDSYVDESSISGEAIPVFKTKKSKVLAGTINQNGSLTLLVEKAGTDTFLAKIIEMVAEAQGTKAPVQLLVDKIAAVFVPTVLMIAILSFFIWLSLGGKNATSLAMLTSLSILVIACPCALGLATPTAVMVGIGKAAQEGILIKSANALVLASEIDTLVIDKTGTLTEGKTVVQKWQLYDETAEMKSLIKSMEGISEHPLAKAIVQLFNDYETVELQSFENIPGKGIKASYKNENYFVGNIGLLKEQNPNLVNNQLKSWETEGFSLVCFFTKTRLLGVFAVSDSLKSNASSAIRSLKKLGIKVVMLSGDNLANVRKTANDLGIEDFRGECLPTDKYEYISKLKNAGHKVAMVGDGINDTISLAGADVGISMGSGADIALEAADIALVRNDLSKIASTITIAKLTVKTIKQNLFWAFIYNILGIPIAAGILYPINGFLINPMIAGAAMAFSSVSVVSNSIWLKFKK